MTRMSPPGELLSPGHCIHSMDHGDTFAKQIVYILTANTRGGAPPRPPETEQNKRGERDTLRTQLARDGYKWELKKGAPGEPLLRPHTTRVTRYNVHYSPEAFIYRLPSVVGGHLVRMRVTLGMHVSCAVVRWPHRTAPHCDGWVGGWVGGEQVVAQVVWLASWVTAPSSDEGVEHVLEVEEVPDLLVELLDARG
jgi:hypothetical protein